MHGCSVHHSSPVAALPSTLASFVLGAILVTATLGGCGGQEAAFPTDEEVAQLNGLRRIKTRPRSPTNQYADSPAAATLGEALFHDVGLSGCGTIACASCHVAPSYTFAAATPPGCNGNAGRNAPTLLNIAFSDWLGWDGRKDSIWSQAMFPLLNPIEMAGEPEKVRTLLQSKYADQYTSLFGKAPAVETDVNRVLANFGKAIEAYERTLQSGESQFDTNLERFLGAVARGEGDADPSFLQFKTYIRQGCIVCHKGPTLSDGSFHNIGLKQAGADHGRKPAVPELLKDAWNGAGDYSDDKRVGSNKLASLGVLTDLDLDGAFKTPTLRDISKTGPYMHTGELATLADVVEFYNRGGDPDGTFPGTRAKTINALSLSASEKQALLDLLNSLASN